MIDNEQFFKKRSSVVFYESKVRITKPLSGSFNSVNARCLVTLVVFGALFISSQ